MRAVGIIMVKKSIMIGNGEKELYRIFKDLERYGRTTFSYPDRAKHTGIARSIGIRGKPLVKNNLLVPPLSSTNSHRMTGVLLPTDVKIYRKKTRNGYLFTFQRE
jgi:hypothetical protein